MDPSSTAPTISVTMDTPNAKSEQKPVGSEDVTTTHINEDIDPANEVKGTKLALIHLSICLCTFLVGLVSRSFHGCRRRPANTRLVCVFLLTLSRISISSRPPSLSSRPTSTPPATSAGMALPSWWPCALASPWPARCTHCFPRKSPTCCTYSSSSWVALYVAWHRPPAP